MASVSKIVCIHEFDDIVNKYYKTCHRTIKIKPADVNSNTYIDSKKEVNNKEPKFKIGDIVRVPKYKNIFAKGCNANQIGSNKLKKLCRETYIINNLNGKKTVRTFSEKNYKKQIKKQFRI